MTITSRRKRGSLQEQQLPLPPPVFRGEESGLTRHGSRGKGLCAFGWQGSSTACSGDRFLSADLAGGEDNIKDSEKNGGGALANCTFLDRVVSQKNTWEGFAGGFCEVRASSLYPILSRLASVTG